MPGFWNDTRDPSRYVAGFGFVAPRRFVYVMGEMMMGFSFLPVIGSDITSSDGPSASIQYQYVTSTSPVSSRYVQLPLFCSSASTVAEPGTLVTPR